MIIRSYINRAITATKIGVLKPFSGTKYGFHFVETKNHWTLILVFLLLPILVKGQERIQAKPITVCGRILDYSNFSNRKTIGLIYNNTPIPNQITIVSDIDDEGRFKFRFNRYTAQDVMIEFTSLFTVFVCPGDSLYIEFEASSSCNEVYNTIRFGGDRKADNENIAKYTTYFTQNRPSNVVMRDTKKDCTPEQFVSYIDSVRTSLVAYYHKLIRQNPVSDTAKAFIYGGIQAYYLDELATYPDNHLEANNLKKSEWFVDDRFFDPIINAKITESMVLNTDVSKWYIDRYLTYCIRYLNQKHLFQKGIGQFVKNGTYDVFVTTTSQSSQAKPISDYEIAENEIKPIMEYTHGGIVRQLLICKHFSDRIDQAGINYFLDKNRKKVFDKYVKNKRIRQQFLDYYLEPKGVSEKEADVAILLKDSTLQNIINANKGKTLYIDCWGTWCSPCLHAMPYTKELMETYKTNDLAFVFICIDSPEDQWKLTIRNQHLKGIHYWFDKDSSTKLRAAYGIGGIPYYFLIDKKGQIQTKGNKLRPFDTDTKKIIDKMLNNN